MAEPGLSDVHVDTALTDFSVAYFQNLTNFVAADFAPTAPSGKQSNKYYVYDKAETMRSDAQKRAPGTEAPVRNYTLSQGSFFCDVYSIASDVSEQVRANADPALDVEEDAARVCAEDIRIKMEIDFATEAFATSKWGTDVTGGTNFTKWSDPSSSPLEDVATGIDTVEAATGYTPNTLLLGAKVVNTGLRNHPDIIARLPDNAPRVVTREFLANLFGVDRVLIAKSIRNTADEGATGSYSRILGNHALLAYVDPNPGLRLPTAMRRFVWSGLVGSEDGIRTKRMEMPWKDALPRVETDAAWDFKVTGSDLGYFLSTCV